MPPSPPPPPLVSLSLPLSPAATAPPLPPLPPLLPTLDAALTRARPSAQLDSNHLVNVAKADARISSQISELLRERAEGLSGESTLERSCSVASLLGSTSLGASSSLPRIDGIHYRLGGLGAGGAPPLSCNVPLSRSSSSAALASGSGRGGLFGAGLDDEGEGADCAMQQKQRFVWSPELHKRFEAAVAQLGIEAAKPQAISQLMGVHGENAPTRQNIKSHLQKYRLLMKKKAAASEQEPERDSSPPPSSGGTRSGRQAAVSRSTSRDGPPSRGAGKTGSSGGGGAGGGKRGSAGSSARPQSSRPSLPKPSRSGPDDGRASPSDSLTIEMHELGDIPGEAFALFHDEDGGADWMRAAGMQGGLGLAAQGPSAPQSLHSRSTYPRAMQGTSQQGVLVQSPRQQGLPVQQGLLSPRDGIGEQGALVQGQLELQDGPADVQQGQLQLQQGQLQLHNGVLLQGSLDGEPQRFASLDGDSCAGASATADRKDGEAGASKGGVGAAATGSNGVPRLVSTESSVGTGTTAHSSETDADSAWPSCWREEPDSSAPDMQHDGYSQKSSPTRGVCSDGTSRHSDDTHSSVAPGSPTGSHGSNHGSDGSGGSGGSGQQSADSGPAVSTRTTVTRSADTRDRKRNAPHETVRCVAARAGGARRTARVHSRASP